MPTLLETEALFITIGSKVLRRFRSPYAMRWMVRTWTQNWIAGDVSYEPFVDQFSQIFTRLHRKPTADIFHRFLPEISPTCLNANGLNYILKEYREMIDEYPFSFKLWCVGSYPNNNIEDTSSDISVIQIIELLAAIDLAESVFKIEIRKEEKSGREAELIMNALYRNWRRFNEIPDECEVKHKLDELLNYFRIHVEKKRLSCAVDMLLRYEHSEILRRDNEVEIERLP